MTVTRVGSFDEALAEANAIDYGLTAGVFSRDEAEVDALPRRDRGGRRLRQPARGRDDGRVAWVPVVLRLEEQRLDRQGRPRPVLRAAVHARAEPDRGANLERGLSPLGQERTPPGGVVGVMRLAAAFVSATALLGLLAGAADAKELAAARVADDDSYRMITAAAALRGMEGRPASAPDGDALLASACACGVPTKGFRYTVVYVPAGGLVRFDRAVQPHDWLAATPRGRRGSSGLRAGWIRPGAQLRGVNQPDRSRRSTRSCCPSHPGCGRIPVGRAADPGRAASGRRRLGGAPARAIERARARRGSGSKPVTVPTRSRRRSARSSSDTLRLHSRVS